MKLLRLISLFVIVSFSMVGYAGSLMATKEPEVTLKETMRRLWLEHGIWTHEYIVAALHDIPNAQLIAKRLLQNQDDIGKAIKPYYGAKAGKQLAQLLKDHILIAVDLVKAAKTNDKALLKDADDRWHKNARDIATFLSKANKHWPEKDLVKMLNQHLQLTSEQVKARLSKTWEKDIALYDQILKQLTMMADALSDGIIKQRADKPEKNKARK